MDQDITNIVSASDNTNDKRRAIKSAVAIILGIVGVVMIIQFIFIVVVIIIGDSLITVNPDTGEKINGVGTIIPDIMKEWKSILIFVLGIICLRISRKALKGKNSKSKISRARIETMEEVKDTAYESANSDLREANEKSSKKISP